MYCERCVAKILPGDEVLVVLHAIATKEEDSDGPYRDESVEWVGHERCGNGANALLPIERITPGPEEVLLASEVELLEKTRQGRLPCPRCETPLRGEFLYFEELYAGVRLSCLSCNFVEY